MVFKGVHKALLGLHMLFFGVAHVALFLLLVLALVVAWLLVLFILCTNCVTGPHEGNPGVVGGGGSRVRRPYLVKPPCDKAQIFTNRRIHSLALVVLSILIYTRLLKLPLGFGYG